MELTEPCRVKAVAVAVQALRGFLTVLAGLEDREPEGLQAAPARKLSMITVAMELTETRQVKAAAVAVAALTVRSRLAVQYSALPQGVEAVTEDMVTAVAVAARAGPTHLQWQMETWTSAWESTLR